MTNRAVSCFGWAWGGAVLLSILTSCTVGWEFVNEKSSPDGLGKIVLSRKIVMMEGGVRIELYYRDQYFRFDPDMEIGVRASDIQWSSDSRRVGVIVCHGIDPRYFGYDVQKGIPLSEGDTAFVLATASGYNPRDPVNALDLVERIVDCRNHQKARDPGGPATPRIVAPNTKGAPRDNL